MVEKRTEHLRTDLAAFRTASSADIPALAHLNEVVQSVHAALYPRDFKTATDPVAVAEFFAARLAEASNTFWIAEIDGAAVGYLWAETQTRPESPFNPSRPRLFVHHLAVLPEQRRRGVATALMRAVEERARADGITELGLASWAANGEAHRFFAAQGFAPAILVFGKRLGAG